MQKIGFQRVNFTDGYDYSVYYDLRATDESTGGKTALSALGMGSPLGFQ